MRHGRAMVCSVLAVAACAAAAAADERKHQDEGGPLRQASLFVGESRAPWRGSQLVLRQSLSAVSLDPSTEQTYNPYYAMTWSFQPWWWFGDVLYVRAQLDVVHELTEADQTTYEGEALVEDLQLVVGGSAVWAIPHADIHLSPSLVLTAPTSKQSRARTMILGIGPGVRLSRSFPVLQGLVVGYNLRVTPRLFRYTTAERETPLIPGRPETVSTGRRNPALRLTQTADISLKVSDWLGTSLVVGHAIDWLHGLAEAPEEVSYQPVEDQDRQFLTFLELTVSFRPIDLLEIGVGYTALHPQLAPDSTYYTPFFNRYSVFFVDLKLHAEALVARASSVYDRIVGRTFQ